jgi:Flp pilus assembly protein TadG
MALLLPVLLLLSVVTIDLGRGIYYYSVIFNAAREGARYGIVHQQHDNSIPSDTAGIEAAVKDLAIGLDQSQLTITVMSPIISETIKVSVIYRFELVTPIAILFKNNGYFLLHTSSSMKIER